MKNKASLSLMELVIMLLVFALVCACCLRAFLWADQQSQQLADKSTALSLAQNAAELLKHYNGDLLAAAQTMGGTVQGNRWFLSFDKAWQLSPEEQAFSLVIEKELPLESLLGSAQIFALTQQGAELLRLQVGWQEVALYE